MRLHSLFDLSGQVALVTGGSRGLGFQIARALGEYGAVVAIAARKRTELDEAVAALEAEGVQATGYSTDLADPAAPDKLIGEMIADLGRLDILVHSAGATWGAPSENYPIDAWDKVIDLNVRSLMLTAQAAAKAAFFPQGSGSILAIASIAGIIGHMPDRVGTVAYNAAKGAMISMTRSLAAEWGPRNIRVNALAPGFFPSKMTAATIGEHGADFVRATPLGRLGSDADIMGPALLLASQAGRHITGQTLVIDGGMTIV